MINPFSKEADQLVLPVDLIKAFREGSCGKFQV